MASCLPEIGGTAEVVSNEGCCYTALECCNANHADVAPEPTEKVSAIWSILYKPHSLTSAHTLRWHHLLFMPHTLKQRHMSEALIGSVWEGGSPRSESLPFSTCLALQLVHHSV